MHQERHLYTPFVSVKRFPDYFGMPKALRRAVNQSTSEWFAHQEVRPRKHRGARPSIREPRRSLLRNETLSTVFPAFFFLFLKKRWTIWLPWESRIFNPSIGVNHDSIDEEEEDTVQVWPLPGFASRETTAGISRRWTSLRSSTMLVKEYTNIDTVFLPSFFYLSKCTLF